MADEEVSVEKLKEIGASAAEGKITDEALGAARAMIGVKLRPEQFLRDASMDTITHFSNGIGELNPLYRDVEYARWTRFGATVCSKASTTSA